MVLLALAIAPGIAICIFIYKKDKYNREPFWLLLSSFILGMASIIPAVIAQIFLTKPLEKAMGGEGILYTAVFSFGLVALSEELSKFLVVRYFCYKRKAFDDPFDGIVYAVMVGMGFATLENIGYVYEHGLATGVLRMFLSVPAHATFAILMGFHIGLAKFDPANRKRHFLLAILLPVLFHGTFDFFLFVGKTGLHFAGAVASFFIAIRLSRKAIRVKQEVSRNYMDIVNRQS